MSICFWIKIIKYAKRSNPHWHKRLFIIILALSIISSAQAQILKDSFQILEDPSVSDLPLTDVNHTLIDDNGFMWIATKIGVFQFDGTSLKSIDIKDKQGHSLKPLAVRKIIKNQANRDWIFFCTYANGLIEYNELDATTLNHLHEPNDPFTLRGNNVISLIQEDKGNFWLATDNFTISYYDRSEQRFLHFHPPRPSTGQEKGILGEMVQCPVNPDILWVGSRLGLYQFNKQSKAFRLIPFEKSYEDALPHQYVRIFADDQEGVLWVGGFNDGLWRYAANSGEVLSRGVLFANRITPSRNVVQAIFPYRQLSI